jgi:hypothetical protein
MTATVAPRQKKAADRPRGAAPSRSRREAGPSLPQALAAPPGQELLEGPTRDDLIRRRAFDLYERNGSVDGRALDDWLTAEAEVGQTVLEGTAPNEAPA